MAQLRVGRNLGPVIEGLQPGDKLKASVSPQSIYSYDEKRPDYVERPYWGGSKYAALSQALAKYVPQLDGMSAVMEDRFKKEQLAIGKRMRQENKVAWKDFSEQHPEYAGLNPHLERGYKAAHLESLGQDFTAALQDHYTTTGLINETDPEKVRNAVDAFGKEWIAANVTQEDFEDHELYEENFFRRASQAEADVMGRHTSDKAREHLRRAQDQYSALLSRDIDAILTNSPGIGTSEGFSAAMDAAANVFAGRVDEMVASGVPRSTAVAWAEDAVLANAKALGGETSSAFGPQILKLLDKVTDGGVPLSAKATVREKVAMLERSWRDERRQAASHGVQMWHFNRAREQQDAINTLSEAVKTAANEGRSLSLNEMMNMVPANRADIAIMWHQKNQTLTEPEWNQSAQRDYQEDQRRVLNNQLDESGVFGLQGKYPYAKWEALLGTARKVRNGDDPVTNALVSNTAKTARAELGAQIKAALGENSGFVNEQASFINAYIAEGEQWLDDELMTFMEESIQKTGNPPGEAQQRLFLRQKRQEIERYYIQRREEIRSDDRDGAIVIQTPDESRAHALTVGLKEWVAKPAWGDPDDDASRQDAVEAIKDAFANPGVGDIKLQNKFGLLPEQIEPFLAAQCALYGLSAQWLDAVLGNPTSTGERR